MDIFLTNLRTGSRLRFPLLPDRLNVKTGASTQAFNIIKIGETKIPRGTTVKGYSWNGTFPGTSMRGMPFVFDWQSPKSIIAILEDWMGRGDTLRLMVTEAGINDDVFIESFVYDFYGVDNASYTLTLSKRRELTINVVQGAPPPPRRNPARPTVTGGGGGKPSSGSGGSSGSNTGGKPGSGSGNTGSTGGGSYRVKAGDSLYSIAKAMLGDGSRWLEIYNMNKATIDKANKGKGVSQYTLQVGIYLRLPAKKAATKPAANVSVFTKTVKSVVSNVSTAVKNFVASPPGKLIVNVAKTAINAFKSLGKKSTVTKPAPTKAAAKSSAVKSNKNFLTKY